MFYSTYIPVNVNRVNCAVYSNEKVYDKEHLLHACDFLTGKDTHNGVIATAEGVSFLDKPDVCWSMPEVFLAHEALVTAEKNRFSFYTVKDMDGIPQLFVSKSFSGHRILVNAFTTRSILLTNPQHVNKVASMIDKCYKYTYCQELYSMLESITDGKNRYLDAIIVGAGSKDEYIAVNQYTVTHGNIIGAVSTEVLADLEKALTTGESNETFSINDGCIKRLDLSYWPAMLTAQAKLLVNVYKKCIEKKQNYVAIINDDAEDGLYLSTNGRYLVHAATLECVSVNNAQVRELLNVMVRRECNSAYDLDWVWRLANKVRQ